jgi:hypothetical protein
VPDVDTVDPIAGALEALDGNGVGAEPDDEGAGLRFEEGRGSEEQGYGYTRRHGSDGQKERGPADFSTER